MSGVIRCQFVFSRGGVIRCQFVFSRGVIRSVIRCRFVFSRGVIRYRFIFSGKNDGPDTGFPRAQLERHWEEALRNRRDLAEEYDRFLKEQPAHLSEDQRARILALSSDLPALWNAPETTAADRKEIIRLVVERVEVHVRAETECGDVVISWRGGVTTANRDAAERQGSVAGPAAKTSSFEKP